MASYYFMSRNVKIVVYADKFDRALRMLPQLTEEPILRIVPEREFYQSR